MTTYAAITELERKRSLTAYIAAPKASVPTAGSAAFESILNSARTALSTSAAARNTYVVRPGDTLSGICETALRQSGQAATPDAVSAAVQRVAGANKLSNVNLLSSGQSIDLSAIRGAEAVSQARLPQVLQQPKLLSQPRVVAAPASTATKAAATKAAAAKSAAAQTLETLPAGRQDGLMALRAELRKQAGAALKEDAVSKLAASVADSMTVKSAGDDAVSKLAAQVLDTPAEVTSEFGTRSDPFSHRQEQHNGIDLAVPSGTVVRAAQPGEVVFSGWQSGYGQTVVVRHADRAETLYAHNSSLLVKEGDVVGPRTVIAKSGSTGRTTGPHLHFEVRANGVAVDPAKSTLAAPSFQIAKAL